MSTWMKLLWYNNFERHWQNRRRLNPGYKEWIAEGRDPAQFPQAGRIDRETLEWARSEAEKISDLDPQTIETRPYSEFRREVKAKLGLVPTSCESMRTD